MINIEYFSYNITIKYMEKENDSGKEVVFLKNFKEKIIIEWKKNGC